MDTAIEKSSKAIIANLDEYISTIKGNLQQITSSAQSYSDTLKNAPTSAQSNQRPHGGITQRQRATQVVKERHVLIDFSSAEVTKSFRKVSDSAMVEKANSALKDLNGVGDCKFLSAARMRNGGILLEMSNAQDIAWLVGAEIKDKFTKTFDPTALIKPQCYSIFIQFVPITFQPEEDTDLRELEEANGMPQDSIVRAKWAKPIECRAPNQLCGHLILVLSFPQAANKILTEGIRICHKLAYATKCRREPLRCLKCHAWNHIASECIIMWYVWWTPQNFRL
jgi:hypothetical protein